MAVEVLKVNGVEVWRIGVLTRVDVQFTPSRGRFEKFANIGPDAKVAVELAYRFCKTFAMSIGRPVDWDKWDIALAHQDNRVTTYGPSAGAATAVAIMSAASGLPVDSRVAVTGALSLRGEVEPVGGLSAKLEGALSDPDIDVVVFPDCASSWLELLLEMLRRPDLFVGRRIIAARNMHEVFRQTLLGYDDKAIADSDDRLRSAIVSFGDRSDESALRSLERAYALTPEDLTIQFWYALVNDAMRRSRLR